MKTLKPILLVLACLVAPLARAQVEHYTVSVSMCCPYGIGECWTIVRDGLERLDGVQSISDDACVPEQTGQFKVRDGRLVDADTLTRLFARHRIPADVRGLEITATGRVRRDGARWLFEVQGATQTLALRPLTRKVQWDSTANQTSAPTPEESGAFARLAEQAARGEIIARITGPLVRKGRDQMILEVRLFESPPPVSVPAGK
jgi:hypothetical protein